VFRLPEDAELEIQKKFPNAPIQQITQYLFQLILHKTLMMDHVLSEVLENLYHLKLVRIGLDKMLYDLNLKLVTL